MTEEQAKYLIQILKKRNITFENGLTKDEFFLIEAKFNLQFPPDLRLFLSMALPVSTTFTNWRKALISVEEVENITGKLLWPYEGLIFDINENAFWEESWGPKPDDVVEQAKVVLSYYETYPKLIPIYSHRYLPSFPNEHGNSVLSVYQTDIIYYGNDLATYFAKEFDLTLPNYLFDIPKEPRKIEFWSKFTEY